MRNLYHKVLAAVGGRISSYTILSPGKTVPILSDFSSGSLYMNKTSLVFAPYDKYCLPSASDPVNCWIEISWFGKLISCSAGLNLNCEEVDERCKASAAPDESATLSGREPEPIPGEGASRLRWPSGPTQLKQKSSEHCWQNHRCCTPFRLQRLQRHPTL